MAIYFGKQSKEESEEMVHMSPKSKYCDAQYTQWY